MPDTEATMWEALQKKAPKAGSLCQGSELFVADEGCIAFDDSTGRLWVMKQVSDTSLVEYRNLIPTEKKVFDKSRGKEIRSLLDLGAYRIMSLEESL